MLSPKKPPFVKNKVSNTKQSQISATLLQNFTDQSDIGFTASNHAGQIVLWNPAMAEITGISSDHALRQFIWDVELSLLPPEAKTQDFQARIKSLTSAILDTESQGLSAQKLDVEILQKNGSRIPIQQTFYNITAEQENYLFVVTKRSNTILQNQIELKTSEEKFRNVVAQARDGIVIIDEQEIVLEWNEGWEKISGISRQGAIGLNFTDVMPELFHGSEWAEHQQGATIHNQILRYLALITRTGLPRVIEGRLRHNNGERKWIQAVTFPIHTEKNQLFGMIARDVTSLKQTEERLQRYTRQLETLRQSGLEISAELALDSLIWMIAPRAIELLNGTAMSLYLFNPEKDVLELAISLGDNQPALTKQARRGEELAGWVWETNKPVLLEDYHTGRTGDLSVSYWGKVAGVPIGWGNEFLGVIFVFSDQKFFESDLKILELFSSHAAAAIHNALLHQQLGLLAVTDSLTGVYNRRYFFEMAEKEFQLARRYKHPFSAIMFDLDLFKTVNDTYGHALGDEVLRMVVQRCAAITREADILGRYGGEEFIIALPETGEKDALALAERLRQELASRPVVFQSMTTLVTASFGIATLEAETASLGVLLNHADVALYHVKHMGRNSSAVWIPDFEQKNPSPEERIWQ